MDDTGTAGASVRLDLWLWAARFFKTRRLAKEAVEAGKVEVDSQRVKPSRGVQVGDDMKIVRGDEVFEVVVQGLSAKRGSSVVARTLFSESQASQLARETRRAELRAARAGYRAPESKPDKRARRLIRALGDLDAT